MAMVAPPSKVGLVEVPGVVVTPPQVRCNYDTVLKQGVSKNGLRCPAPVDPPMGDALHIQIRAAGIETSADLS